MKIGIITHSLIDNFGGILQCAALYNHLTEQGHDVLILQKHRKYPLLKKVAFNLLKVIPFQDIRGIRTRHLQHLAHVEFIEKYIPNKSKIVFTAAQLKQIAAQHDFDVVVVGSDQVWRFEYINDGEYGSYFLNFIEPKSDTRKVAYAASFGKDYWEAPDKQQEVASWLKQFDAISVREDSGVEICKDSFSVDAVHVADPTMLVGVDFYNKIISETKFANELSSEYLLTYVLDESTHMKELISLCTSKLSVNDQLHLKGFSEKDTFFTIPEWLRAFRDAKFIITDSFHGTLFCIMFKKQFMVVCNQSRGTARFKSILEIVGLENRIYNDNFDFSNINYDEVSIDAFISESKNFIDKNITAL